MFDEFLADASCISCTFFPPFPPHSFIVVTVSQTPWFAKGFLKKIVLLLSFFSLSLYSQKAHILPDHVTVDSVVL
jgi:hypothetical protein